MPTLFIAAMYSYIYCRTKQSSNITLSNVAARNHKRDLEVLHNIMILLGTYVVGGTPTLLYFITRIQVFYQIGIAFMPLAVAIEKTVTILLNREIRTHIGYTAAALAHRTPNYRELAIKILKDSIERMLTIKVWGYIDYYWENAPTFPDPVCFENIMYRGHLLQLLTHYESISGDFTYDIDGFYFIWDKYGDPITKIHYTTTYLAYVIYRQMNEESSAGVTCEPGWVYTICQNHPHLALRLYDIVRDGKTNFSRISSKWKDFLTKHALEDIPLYKNDRYFKMLYQKSTHIWVPFFASTGNDGWTLAWMSSWFDQNETSNFICDGWKIMYKNKYWKPSTNHTQPDCFLDSGGYIGVRICN
ncbi:unnamed protein product [Rotaria sp. Silwood2]|nr:unnamed protein product [Rotaria sp. Silwood2]